MREIEKNTVPADNQLGDSDEIKFGHDGDGLRILFAGNSITMHGYRPSIGWYGDNYGMAASCEEKDYVHRVMAAVNEKIPNSTYCIAQVAEWEMHYKNGRYFFDKIKAAAAFKPDVLVLRSCENCPEADFDADIFKREFGLLIDFLASDSGADVIFTTSFWHHAADESIKEVAEERGCPLVTLGDLGQDPEMKALGKFEHEGVANHPGDKGMQTIADRIVKAIFEKIKVG